MLDAVGLDVATCIYKCSLYTVGGCIYKLGKFVMANWDVAGTYSEDLGIFSYVFGIHSEMPICMLKNIFTYIHPHICSYIQRVYIHIRIVVHIQIYSYIICSEYVHRYSYSEIFRCA